MLIAALQRIDDPDARQSCAAERACLQALGGGCARPIGAHARFVEDRLTLTAFVGSQDGSRVVRTEASGDSAEKLGRSVAAELLRMGAGELLV